MPPAPVGVIPPLLGGIMPPKPLTDGVALGVPPPVLLGVALGVLPAPPLSACIPSDLRFQLSPMNPLPRPTPLSACPYIYGDVCCCCDWRPFVHPAAKTAAPNQPIQQIKGFLPIGLSSPKTPC